MAAIICRAFKMALETHGSALKPPNALLGCSLFTCIHHYRFVQKHAPCFLHRRQSGQATPASHSQQHSSLLHAFNLGNSFTHNPPPQKCTKDAAFVHFEAAKRKLRGIPHACISYQQLQELCVNCTENSGTDVINSLERSGEILKIGQTVYLHPQQIARAMENVLVLNESDIAELKTLENEKGAIDVESERQVRRELWCGLGFFSLQIAALFRLTFWEFSWDIMEPVCFHITSAYFLLGYAFFLKTSTDPTYQSFHAARFRIKQRKLMQIRKFNLERYTELRRLNRDGRTSFPL